MARKELLNPAQFGLVRSIVQGILARVGKQSAVTAETGISQQQVSKIVNGKLVGLDPAMQLADRGYLDWGEFMALGNVQKPSVGTVKPDDGFPNRETAISCMLQDGAGYEEELREAAYTIKTDVDMPVLWWVREIDEPLQDLRQRKGVTGGAYPPDVTAVAVGLLAAKGHDPKRALHTVKSISMEERGGKVTAEALAGAAERVLSGAGDPLRIKSEPSRDPAAKKPRRKTVPKRRA